MNYIFFINILILPAFLEASTSPRTVGCMHQSSDELILGISDELILGILEAAIHMNSPELFANVLTPHHVSLTDSQAKSLQEKLATTEKPEVFKELLSKKLSRQTANS